MKRVRIIILGFAFLYASLFYLKIETAAALTNKGIEIETKQVQPQSHQQRLLIKQVNLIVAADKRHRATAAGQDIVLYAKQFVGNPYKWGGNSLTNGCDCSHFVWNILKDLGYYTGKYQTSRKWAYLGEAVSSIESAQPGDIIVYSGHVAIYDGHKKIIEAQNPSAGITDHRSVFSSRIVAIRRFINKDSID